MCAARQPGSVRHALLVGRLVPGRVVGTPHQGPRSRQQAVAVDLGLGVSSVALGVPVLQPLSSGKWKLRPGTEGLSHIQALYTQLLNLLLSTTRHGLPHCPHDGVTAQRGAMAAASFTPCSSGRAQQVLGQASSPDCCPSGCLDQTRLPPSHPVLLPADVALDGPQ